MNDEIKKQVREASEGLKKSIKELASQVVAAEIDNMRSAAKRGDLNKHARENYGFFVMPNKTIH